MVLPNQPTPGIAADYVVITISDEGVGISADVLPQIFEPFFTTKPQGTGLGLAMVYGAMQQAFDVVDVVSEVGKGSRFRLLFPRCVRHSDAGARDAQHSRPPAARRTSHWSKIKRWCAPPRTCSWRAWATG